MTQSTRDSLYQASNKINSRHNSNAANVYSKA